jgi:hypothetical protein
MFKACPCATCDTGYMAASSAPWKWIFSRGPGTLEMIRLYIGGVNSTSSGIHTASIAGAATIIV